MYSGSTICFNHTLRLNNRSSKLREVIRWCEEIEIREISIFAFSIENLKRSNEEVQSLFDVMYSEFRAIINNW